MPRGVYAAASAMLTESRSLDVVAQNLANANSSGYRRQVALREGFAEVLAQRGRTGGPEGDGGLGVFESAGARVFTQGELEETNSDFDFAITGDGFFRVRDPQGQSWLTRDGHFSLAGDGRLVDARGWALEGQSGPLVMPPTATRLVADDHGRVYAQSIVSGAPVSDFVDQLRITVVADRDQLRVRDGQHFYAPEGAQTDAPAEGYAVRQGFVERANVDPVTELVSMIAVQRRYDAAQRALRTNDETGRGFSDILHGA